jgi:Methyltransferase domain
MVTQRSTAVAADCGPVKPSAFGTLKRVYAAGAQATGRILQRVGILDDEPPAREHRLRHWAFSLTRAHDSIGISKLDVPWWTYRSIDEVEAWLARRTDDVRAFEWGSGASTIWLARRVASVHSVEHHAQFGRMIQEQLAKFPDAQLEIVDPVPSDTPAIGSAKEGHGGLDFTDYVHRIDAVGGMFDLIVVDGRAREACLTAAIPHLVDDGIIVFDNTLRRRYRAAIAAAPVTERAFRGLTPTLPYPDQTSVLTLR